MKSFEHGFLDRLPVSQDLLRAVGALREFKGPQDLFGLWNTQLIGTELPLIPR